MKLFKHLFHRHTYLKQPNRFGFSLRQCPDGTIQRFSIHSKSWFTITKFLGQYTRAFEQQLNEKKINSTTKTKHPENF